MRLRAVKETLPVTILTLQGYRLVGEIHVTPGSRLTDEVNREQTFLPFTHVSVFNPEGQLMTTMEFMLVNKNNVILVAPTVSNAGEDS
jgi:hypothetical protein